MKKLITIISVFFALVSCLEEPEFAVPEGGNIKDGYMTIEFGHKNFGSVDISTRATVSTAAEDAVINIYVLIFNSNGEKVYGNYFDRDGRKDLEIFNQLNYDCWYVDNQDSGSNSSLRTSGKIKIKAPTALDGTIYLIANLDPAIFNLTEDRLGIIKTEDELHKLALDFNQKTTSRTGNLLMLGSAPIRISGENGSQLTLNEQSSGYSIPLVRIDSKIEVKVGVIPGAITTKYVTDEQGNIVYETDVNGNRVQKVESTQEIESFTPTSWKVVNLPKDTWLVPRSDGLVDAKKEGGYFNSSTHLFETKEQDPYEGQTRTLHGFSFYMTESYPADNDKMGGIKDGNYHNRDKRQKNSDGTYMYPESSNENIWVYAPKDAAYLVIEGEVQMKVNEQALTGGKQQTLNALVRYYVHLGDFAADVNNYDIERNTHYTYTINIKGVNNIEIEVERDNNPTYKDVDNEKQSGATGEVYIAQEEIHTFDSHYGQRVYKFNFDAMLHSIGVKVSNGIIDNSYTEEEKAHIADGLTWYVSTPFGREGGPDIVNNGVEVPAGLDYKWVYFLINEKDTSEGTSKYRETGQWYPGDQWKDETITGTGTSADGKRLMDVSALCTYLREQITRKALGREHDFDTEGNIRFTAFVDEYYYDADPISGITGNDFWHNFANKPIRMMHILCSSESSRDGESTATGSVVTIRQRSIQTVYNTNVAIEGWGAETVDDIRAGRGLTDSNPFARNSVGFYYKDSRDDGDIDPVGNNSKRNGLYNTARLWKLVRTEGGTEVFNTGSRWDTYLDMERPNDYDGSADNKSGDLIYGYMKDDYATLRYSCLSRNRDNNGNGVIDKDEVRWYLASTEQLVTLFIGDQGLSTSAQLYNLESPTTGNFKCHVVSSTANSTSVCTPQKIFAEEGCSIGGYRAYDGGDITIFSIRCVRNFGNHYDLLKEESAPKSPVVVSEVDGDYLLDLTNLNTSSQRIRVTDELVPQDETSEMSRPASSFITGIVGNQGKPIGKYTAYENEVKNYLTAGYSYCPEGYRLPNIREGAIMYNYIDDASFWDGKYYMVSSYYRFGELGVAGQRLYPNSWSWFFGSSIISVGNASGNDLYVRCVRDVD